MLVQEKLTDYATVSRYPGDDAPLSRVDAVEAGSRSGGPAYKDHNPPHFHANYGNYEIAVSIRDGTVLWGTFPTRALAHVMEWREAHVTELEEDWERARTKQPLLPVEPLE